MFATQIQQAMACMALCDSLPATRGMWTADGPTKRALRPGPMASSERLMLQIAFAVWNNDRRARFSDALAVLDNERLRMVGSLFVALADGSGSVTTWLKRYLCDGPAPERAS